MPSPIWKFTSLFPFHNNVSPQYWFLDFFHSPVLNTYRLLFQKLCLVCSRFRDFISDESHSFLSFLRLNRVWFTPSTLSFSSNSYGWQWLTVLDRTKIILGSLTTHSYSHFPRSRLRRSSDDVIRIVFYYGQTWSHYRPFITPHRIKIRKVSRLDTSKR